MSTEQTSRSKSEVSLKLSIPKEISDAVAEQPRLVRVLSLFVWPIEIEFIEASGFSFSSWEKSGVVAILTNHGPYLRSITREFVRTHSTPEELDIARQDFLRIIDQSVMGWGDKIPTQLRSRRAESCANAGYRSQLIIDVSWLCEEYKRENQPYELVLLLSKTNLDASELPSQVQEIALWAYAQTNWHPSKK